MNKTQKAKRNFRASKIWKAFRHEKNVEQKGIDPITKSKLKGRWCLHHRHVTASNEEYCDISKPEEYVALMQTTHKFLHWGYTYYKKYGQEFLDLIQEEWERWF
jgi:hypothetical protein